jgi:hypothetical protein
MDTEKQKAAGQYIKMDWSLENPADRVALVEKIIANTPSEKLNTKYLDKLAEYITYPTKKEERLKDKKIITNNRKKGTLDKREISYEGLVGKLENGEDGIYNMMINDKNAFLDRKKKISQEDIDTIPGLKELVAEIKKIEAMVKEATGKRKYLLMQQVIEMRQDQYEIRNAYLQPRYSRILTKTLTKLNLPEHIELRGDDIISDAKINLFTPAHVVALLCNYSGLKMESWDKFDSDIKWVMMDLEHLIDSVIKNNYPLYYKLIIYKIDGKTNLEIQKLLEEEFNVKYSVEYLSALWRKKIPKLIVEEAEREWITWYYTIKEQGKWKRCSRCKKIKLANSRFFSKNSTAKDHFYSICKECRNKKK